MRSFVASVALLLAAAATAVSLASYLVHETVLDPDNAGPVLARAVDNGQLRSLVLSRALPRYDSLPSAYREDVDRVASSPRVERALSRVNVNDDGTVDITPVRRELAASLRAEGYGQLAQAAASGGTDRVRLPRRLWSTYQDAQDATWFVATRGALLAGALFVAAFVISPHRRRLLVMGAVSLLLSGVAAMALVRRLPGLAEAADAGAWVTTAARVAVPDVETVLPTLLPLGVVAGALLVASFLVPRRSV